MMMMTFTISKGPLRGMTSLPPLEMPNLRNSVKRAQKMRESKYNFNTIL